MSLPDHRIAGGDVTRSKFTGTTLAHNVLERHQVGEVLAQAAAAGAGATTLWEDVGHHLVMADPEGNEFCVC